jgi:hypothetical protein
MISEYYLAHTKLIIMEQIISILQLSIGPVVLISGVGLIILSQTNRMTNITSRIRWIKKEVEPNQQSRAQILLLYRRSRVVRFSLIALILCIFLDSLVILALFAAALLGVNWVYLVISLFTLSLISLIIGLGSFLFDVNLNLKAIQIEVERAS